MGHRKISDADIVAMRDIHAIGANRKSLARFFNVAAVTVTRTCNEQSRLAYAICNRRRTANPELLKHDLERQRLDRTDIAGRCKQALKNAEQESKRKGYAACTADWVAIATALVNQNYKCKITGLAETDRLCMDHCHVTGKFRGWLHRQLNAPLETFIHYKNEIIAYINESQ